MTIGKLFAIAIDIGAGIILLWWLYLRATGVPMEAADWLLLGWLSGSIVTVFNMNAKGMVR